MNAERQFGAGHIDAAGNGHVFEFGHGAAVDDDQIFAPVFHGLQFGRRNMRGLEIDLDEFTERLGGHVDAAKDLEPGRGPACQPAFQEGNVRIAEAHQPFRPARHQIIVFRAAGAQHNGHVAPRHQIINDQLQPAQRQGYGEQQVALAEGAFFAQVQQRQLIPAHDHRLEIGGGNGFKGRHARGPAN